MAKYVISDGKAMIEVVKGVLTGLWLTEKPVEPITIKIPYKVGKQTINYVGQDSKSINRGIQNRELSLYPIDNSLISLDFDDNIKVVGSWAFSHISAGSIHWPKGCKEVPDNCFSYSFIGQFNGMTDITDIHTSAFSAINTLKGFHIPNACKSIGTLAFSDSNIEEITGGENTTCLGTAIFAGSSLKRISWFPKVNDIPPDTFKGCKSLREVCNIDHVTSVGEEVFCMSGLTQFHWPDSCNTIPTQCFYGCINLKSVSNMDNVSHIQRGAFDGCFSLSEVSLPKALVEIGRRAFANTKIKQIDFSNMPLEFVGKGAFLHSCAEKMPDVPFGCIVEEPIV